MVNCSGLPHVASAAVLVSMTTSAEDGRVVTSDTGLLRSWFVFLSTFKALKALYRRSNLTPHPEFAHLWLQARNVNLTKLQGQDSILNPGNSILWMWGPGVLGAILGVGTVAQ